MPRRTTRLAHRHLEAPQRPAAVWAMDVSKQLLSSGTAHGASIVVAMWLQGGTSAPGAVVPPQQHTSECSWYLITFTVGTTAGVALTLWLHDRAVRHAAAAAQAAALVQRQQSSESTQLLPARQSAPEAGATTRAWLAVAECGKYGQPPSVSRWALQV